MSNDKKDGKNILNLGKKEPSDLEKAMQQAANQPPEVKFMLVLIQSDAEKKQIQVVFATPPSGILVLKNREQVFQFSHLAVQENGPVFVYVEVSSTLFDLKTEKEPANDAAK